MPVPNSIFASTVGLIALAAGSMALDPTEMPWLQFGAFGLCAYMVWKNYRDRSTDRAEARADREALVDQLAKRDEILRKLHERTVSAIEGCLEQQKEIKR